MRMAEVVRWFKSGGRVALTKFSPLRSRDDHGEAEDDHELESEPQSSRSESKHGK